MNDAQPIRRQVDQHAIHIPKNSGLLPCLYIPIAARDLNAIETYVGRIIMPLTTDATDKALVVEAHEPEKADDRLAIWRHPAAGILQHSKQVWVHVDFRNYRRGYMEAFPDFDLSGLVICHVMDRRVARLKGFMYLRIIPVSRGGHSSHGALSAGWAVEYHSSPEMRERNRLSQAAVQYADLADIAKMLQVKNGGSFVDKVKETQKLVDLPDATS
jgi:hypothetical protein